MNQSANKFSFETENHLRRAVIYNFFACLFGKKIDELWLDPGFQKLLNEELPSYDGKMQLLDHLNLAGSDLEAFNKIQNDFDNLFNIPSSDSTFPYESCYAKKSSDGTFGRLWQEPARDMQRIFKGWEIEFSDGWNLIPDHIAMQLFFMSHLCYLSVSNSYDQKEKLKIWQTNFFNQHLVNWVFAFLANVERRATTAFYRGGAQLLTAFLRRETSELFLN